jgi:predicted HicB family RNase H-like nuclease
MSFDSYSRAICLKVRPVIHAAAVRGAHDRGVSLSEYVRGLIIADRERAR